MRVAALASVAVFASWGAFSAQNAKNQLVIYDRNIQGAWSQVQLVYQRRAKLVPKLVETVTAYAGEVPEPADLAMKAFTRTSGLAASSKVSLPTAPLFNKLEQAQLGLSAALSHLLLAIEQNPDLGRQDQVAHLHRQLAEVERRLGVEKRRFNQVVQDYNAEVASFPTVLFASLLGFDPRPFFEKTESTLRAPGADI